MQQSVRSKLFFSFILYDLLITVSVGIFVYYLLAERSFRGFKEHYMSLARLYALGAPAEKHSSFNSLGSLSNPDYKKYRGFLKEALEQEKDIRFIYSLSYDATRKKFYHAVNASDAKSDSVWIETDTFAINCILDDSGKIIVDYDYVLYSENFLIERNGEKFPVSFREENNFRTLWINDQKIITVKSFNPPKIIIADNVILGREKRTGKSELKLNNKNTVIHFSLVVRGEPATNPGMEFVESEKMILKIRKVLSERIDFVDADAKQNVYGNFLGVYSVIKDASGKGTGAIVMGINYREIKEFRDNIFGWFAMIFIVRFIVAIIASFAMARYFTRPLEELSQAVKDIASGNLETTVNISSHDEFGKLAKSFNDMITSVRQSIRVQDNLVREITDLNESLERKVQERTTTIRNQSLEMSKQIGIAKKLQLSLLPEKIPNLNGADLSFKYVPVMEIGGDFIDIFYKNESELGIFICDVSGHGVPAALLASMVKMSLQNWYESIENPAASMEELQKSLVGKMSGHFISALMCYVDLKTGKLISANAGHLPILRLSNSGEVDLIRSKGKIIHETFPTGCEENICNLRKGDKIILYTDGVTEARNENYEMFGEELLIQSARENSMRDAVFTCNDIFESVMRFTGSLQKLEDDFTILTLEYHGRNSSSGKL